MIGIYFKNLKKESIAPLFKAAVQSEYLKNTAKLLTGTALAQIIAVAASPILSRLYTPADFGTFALYNSTLSILLIFCTGRYDLAIVSAKQREKAIQLVSLSFILLGVLFFLVSLLLVFFHNRIVALVEHPQFGQAIWLLPISFLFMGAYQVLSYWSNREKNYNFLASSKIAQNSTNVLVSVIIGLVSSLGIGLVWGAMVGAVVAVSLLMFKSRNLFKELREALNTKALKACAVEYQEFPKFSLPTAFLDTFTNQMPVFLITIFFTEALAGHFAFAYRILSLPISLVGASMGQVFYQKLTEIHHNQQSSRNFILKMWGFLFVVGVVPFTVLLFFGSDLFTLLFGAEWEEAGRISAILAIPLLFMFCSSPTSTAFIVFGIQRYSLVFGLLFIVLRPLAFYIGYLKQDIFLGLILWGTFDVILIILYNFILIKKSAK